MTVNLKIISSFLVLASLVTAVDTVVPISRKSFAPEGANLVRGDYLIILANSQLRDVLTNPDGIPVYGDNFTIFKQTQGFDVEIITLDEENLETSTDIRSYLEAYHASHPLLEYVLLVGDVNGDYTIPTFFIASINEDEEDVTDYPYTFFDDNPESENYDILDPKFFIGRWSVRNIGDLINVKVRSMEYIRMENIQSSGELDYLNRALLVAGNYKTNDGMEVPPEQWPVTPVWTSQWLMERLLNNGFTSIDTAYFHMNYQVIENPLVTESWSNGVGIINYRGWGNSHGWHRPSFYIEDLNDLNHGWKLPVVMSFVCNTGDFGADLYPQTGPSKCFGEELITKGTPSNPKGAVAVIGPSDLDTDTKYNNVICGTTWDNLLENRSAELGPALFAGKQALIDEFPQLAGPGDVVEFYHHIYGIIGDPSLPVWLTTPSQLSADVEEIPELHRSFIQTIISDENGIPLKNVVGALILDDVLIGKGVSGPDGQLNIDFSGLSEETELNLYLNLEQFQQKKIILSFVEDDGTPFDPPILGYFDVFPVIASGENYIEANHTFDLSLEITNLSPDDYQGITVGLSALDEGTSNTTFTSEEMNISAFATELTGTVVTGQVEDIPRGSKVRFRVEIEIGDEPIAADTVSLLVGPVETSDPIPPDDYGYWAYDNSDVEYEEAPDYDWLELNPEEGGIGEDLGLTDDTHTDISIGFPFRYYGMWYDSITVCSNGWISVEPSAIDYFWNFSIPMSMGPFGMIAPFMDDLDDNDGTEPFHVYAWQDASNGRLIIQWDNVANGEDDESCPDCVRETFQLILYDPSLYPTATGDGEIVFQYQEINDIDANGNYSTVGIESPDQNLGVQYLFNQHLAAGAVMPTEGVAVKFTTDAPPNAIMETGESTAIADQYSFSPAYPNPFNAITSLRFQIPIPSRVKVIVYDILGREVRTLLNSTKEAGIHQLRWSGRDHSGNIVSSGIYFIRFESEKFSQTRKVLLLK
ncbi:MAG TPA: T9SS type A sorting domain-containing protein [Candidatus Marinimicrobia bacterium]|nr:T9SS type A sorting domain-containing protein [Candidatus Neomarinimicrobiota bacterium]